MHAHSPTLKLRTEIDVGEDLLTRGYISRALTHDCMDPRLNICRGFLRQYSLRYRIREVAS